MRRQASVSDIRKPFLPRICSRGHGWIPALPPPFKLSATSRCGSLLRTLSADGRSTDDVIAFEGFSAYNEGCHDDVNKHVWLAVFWGCDDSSSSSSSNTSPPSCALDGRDGLVAQWLTEYAGFHVSPSLATSVTDLIFALEDNWVGK